MFLHSAPALLLLLNSVLALPSSQRRDGGTWSLPSDFSSFDDFNLIQFDSGGKSNCQILTDGIPSSDAGGRSGQGSVIQVLYPEGSSNPGSDPVGGCQFYGATSLDLSSATSVTLKYQVYFAPDFDWVKGGKLPGLYGGKEGCSGGDSATDCWSSRHMWRTNGAGELYLYVSKQDQDPGLCEIGPESHCNPEYGDSIGRGSFYFTQGGWTEISQTITLSSSPTAEDGSFSVSINGQGTSINFDKVAYSAGFKGVFFSTFFGGNGADWAPPKDEHAYFKDFSVTINY